MTRRERLLARVLVGVLLLVVAGVGAAQIFGAPLGGRCVDSYACRGFLVGGAECVDTERGTYCTRYCRDDAGCPAGWRCAEANPTALRIETRAVGRVCVRAGD